jgi:periplasmic copper chaperone A
MKPLALGLVLAALAFSPAAAHQYRLGDLHIIHPASRPAAEGMNGVGYLTVTNGGEAPDTLLAVETPAAARVEIHAGSTAGGVMRMRKLRRGLVIPAKGRAELQPGGDHVMMLKLKRPLGIGDKVPATLVFKNAGRVQVHFLVQRGAPKAARHGH